LTITFTESAGVPATEVAFTRYETLVAEESARRTTTLMVIAERAAIAPVE
jgi:hypothetical protein